MADTLTSILKKLLNQPTAPFHEYHVRAQIEQFLLDVPHVELSNDGFGNLIATYRKGKRKPNPAWVLGGTSPPYSRKAKCTPPPAMTSWAAP